MTTSPVSPHTSNEPARKPGIDVVPAYDLTFADPALALMKRAGKPLDLWQADAIRGLLAVRADLKWACYEYAELVARQNGKGGIGECRALAGLFLLGEELIMWSAHEYKTAMEAWRRIRTLIQAMGKQVGRDDTLWEVDGIPIKILKSHTEEGFERLDTHQRIRFVARSTQSGRGFSGDINILDESFAYTWDQHDALGPTLRARPNPQFLYLSSPPLSGEAGPGEVLFSLLSRAETLVRRSLVDGKVDAARLRELAAAEGLGYRDWGAAGLLNPTCDPAFSYDLDHLENLDLGDPGLWMGTNPALPHRISWEQMERDRRGMSSVGFAREILGLWPARKLGGGVIDAALWARLGLDSMDRGDCPVALMVEVSPLRDHGAISLYWEEDGVGYSRLSDYRSGVDWIVSRLVDLRALNPLGVGITKGTFETLERELSAEGFQEPKDPEKPQPGDLMILTGNDMAAACGGFIDAIRRKAVRHLRQEPLEKAVDEGKIRFTGDRVAWVRRGATADIAPLLAATGARWVYLDRVDRVRDDYDPLASIPTVEGQCPYCDAWSRHGEPIEHYEDCLTLKEG